MAKVLFRWIVGDVGPEGISVFSRAVKNILKLHGRNFDFLICSNAVQQFCRDQIKEICLKYKVDLYQQKWDDLPLDKNAILEDFDVQSEVGIPRGRQGTFWKLCPARLEINRHEIICDNDLVFEKNIEAVSEFMEKEQVLMIKEDAFCVGKYFTLFGDDDNYNSGLYGLPPGYDFAEDIRASWERHGRLHGLFWRDEQGLITSTLKKKEHLAIRCDEIIHLFSQGRCWDYEFKIIEENKVKTRVMSAMQFKDYHFSNKDKAYHFLGVNRDENHKKWLQYKNLKKHGLLWPGS